MKSRVLLALNLIDIARRERLSFSLKVCLFAHGKYLTREVTLEERERESEAG